MAKNRITSTTMVIAGILKGNKNISDEDMPDFVGAVEANEKNFPSKEQKGCVVIYLCN